MKTDKHCASPVLFSQCCALNMWRSNLRQQYKPLEMCKKKFDFTYWARLGLALGLGFGLVFGLGLACYYKYMLNIVSAPWNYIVFLLSRLSCINQDRFLCKHQQNPISRQER